MLKISTTSRSPRKLSFDLLKEVQVVTSQLTWLEELVPFVEEGGLELAPDLTMKGYMKVLLEHGKLEDLTHFAGRKGGDDEDDIAHKESTIGFIAMKLNIATMNVYVSDFKTAREEIMETRGYLTGLMADPAIKNILEYLLDALEWAADILESCEEGRAEEAVTEDHFQQVASLCRRWDEFQPDTDNRTKAVVMFLKGCLASAMKVTAAKVLEFFVQATKLDPNCHIWFHYAYRKMRCIRKNKKVRGEKLPAPGGEEIRLCKTAFQKRPNHVMDVYPAFDYAVLLKEKLWLEHETVWDKQELDYLKCQHLFEEALSIANQTNKIIAIKVKVAFAEFLLFGKGVKLDQEKGRRLLRECEIEYPHNSEVLHKMGKLYHRGAYGTKKWRNPVLAEKLYQRAIADEAGNFPCLMDYLSLLEESKNKEYEKMLGVIDRALEFAKRDHIVARLHAKKGRFLWDYYFACQDQDRTCKTKACESWIHVKENLPDYITEIYRETEDKPYVILTLKEMLAWEEYKSKQRVITDLIEDLRKRMSDEAHRVPVRDVHRGSRPGPKPLVFDRSGSAFSMKQGKGKRGMIRN